MISGIIDGDEVADALFADDYDDDEPEGDFGLFRDDEDRINMTDTQLQSPVQAKRSSDNSLF